MKNSRKCEVCGNDIDGVMDDLTRPLQGREIVAYLIIVVILILDAMSEAGL